jgi:hypothetical protein
MSWTGVLRADTWFQSTLKVRNLVMQDDIFVSPINFSSFFEEWISSEEYSLLKNSLFFILFISTNTDNSIHVQV